MLFIPQKCMLPLLILNCKLNEKLSLRSLLSPPANVLHPSHEALVQRLKALTAVMDDLPLQIMDKGHASIRALLDLPITFDMDDPAGGILLSYLRAMRTVTRIMLRWLLSFHLTSDLRVIMAICSHTSIIPHLRRIDYTGINHLPHCIQLHEPSWEYGEKIQMYMSV